MQFVYSGFHMLKTCEFLFYQNHQIISMFETTFSIGVLLEQRTGHKYIPQNQPVGT